MVITLSHTFLMFTGLNIKIGTLCHIVHLFNSIDTTDKFKDTLYNLPHTQNMSSCFIPEYSLTLPLEAVHPQHPCLWKICSVHDLKKRVLVIKFSCTNV